MKNPFILMLVMLLGAAAQAQPQDPLTQLSGFDQYMEQLLQDWNAPGVGVGVVVKGKLVLSKATATGIMTKKRPSRAIPYSRLLPIPNCSRQLPSVWR